MNNPCRHRLRGEESHCNGGGYDGCACGPYDQTDKARLRRHNEAEGRKPLRRIIATVDFMLPADEGWTTEDFEREFRILLEETYQSHPSWPIRVSVKAGRFEHEVDLEEWRSARRR